MKIDTPEFQSVITEELKTLQKAFTENGHEIRIAGGAVRDLLLGKKPSALDFATTATPKEIKHLFMKLNIGMYEEKEGKTGEISIRLNDKDNFFITTLRTDMKTDSRHTEVAFMKDWLSDANRRDFTINSMFLDLDGLVYDYFHGYDDLKERRVVFVGDVNDRVRRDPLSILRYFRLYGAIAENPDSHNQNVLKALEKNVDGLKSIPGEEIWAELNKILVGNFAGELLKLMISLGMGPYIGFPDNCNINELNEVWNALKKNKSEYLSITLLSALFDTSKEFENFSNRAKISEFERELGDFIIQHRKDEVDKDLSSYIYLILYEEKTVLDIKKCIEEFFKYRGNMQLLDEFRIWPIQRIPVTAYVLIEGDSIKKEDFIEGGKRKRQEVEDLNIATSTSSFSAGPSFIFSPPCKKAALENSGIFQDFLHYLSESKNFSIRNFCLERGLRTPPGNVPMGKFDSYVLRNTIVHNLCQRSCNLKPGTIFNLVSFLQVKFEDLTYQVRLQILLHLSKLNTSEEKLDKFINTFAMIGKEKYNDEDQITEAPEDIVALVKTALKQTPILMAIRKALNSKLKDDSVSDAILLQKINDLNILYSKRFSPLDGIRGVCLLNGVYLCEKELADHSGTKHVFNADIITLAAHEFTHFIFRTIVGDFNASSPYKVVEGGKPTPVFDPVFPENVLELGRNVELILFDQIQPNWKRSTRRAAEVFLERLQTNCSLPVIKEIEHDRLGIENRDCPSLGFGIDMTISLQILC